MNQKMVEILKQIDEEKETTLSKINKVRQQLKDHAQRRIDKEKDGELVAHEKVSHENIRKQLMTKLQKLQSKAKGEW